MSDPADDALAPSQADLEFSLILHPDDVGEEGRQLKLRVADDICAKLAERFHVTTVCDLELDVTIMRAGQGLHVYGQMVGQVTQPCAVSLEPVTNWVVAHLNHSFQPLDYIQSLGLDPDDLEADIPEEMGADGAEIGGLCLEEFALEIPIYPRAEGVYFDREQGEKMGLTDRVSPFSVLENLKKNDES